MQKILIVGQAPSRVKGRSSGRLAKLAGLTRAEFEDRTVWKNLINSVQGKQGKGDAFPMAEAKKAAIKILDGIPAESAILLLGGNVARAFGFKPKYFNSIGPFKIFPHPSGINRWYNDPRNVRKAQKFLRKIFG